MQKLFRNFCISLLVANLVCLQCFALEFDMSVDEEIRKNYNPSKLELEGLPPVPSVKPTTPSQPVTSIPKTQPISVPPSKTPVLTAPSKAPVVAKTNHRDSYSAIKIPRGTKFRVKSGQTISDASRVGTKLSFVSQQSVTKRYVTIPQGTVFKGEVIDSHLPQKTGNGGLIVLKVNAMILKGSTVGINAKVTKANHKMIFLNNIKGQRKYLKGVANSLKPGTRFYKKMMRTTSKLASNNLTLILTPFTAVAGVVVYGVNVIGSPVLGLFSEGGRISVPAGSEFEIKLLEDVYLY